MLPLYENLFDQHPLSLTFASKAKQDQTQRHNFYFRAVSADSCHYNKIQQNPNNPNLNYPLQNTTQ